MLPASHSAVPLSFAHIAAGAPWWLYALVIAGLVLHIGGGSVGIVTGYGAVSVRKGEYWHRLFGKIFVAAMVVMAIAATALAIDVHQPGNIGGGILAFYLVLTGWMTVRRPEGAIGRFEKLAALVPIALAILFLSWGIEATRNGGQLDGYLSTLYYAFVGICAFFAVIDLRVIAKGELRGTARIARHLWRMCFAFFFAAGSFFLGQQKVMPAWMHGLPVLWVLGLAPLGFMLFWLVRIRIGRRFKPAPLAA